MQSYPVRTSHRANLNPGAIARILQAHFDSAATEGESVTASFGAITRIVVRVAGKELSVDVIMNPKVPDAIARETIGRYNRFLEEATGYSAKERAKRLRKTAGESPPGG